ncbi:hypothetical protein B0T21DRAFT_420578 [Apiosordaria backusii]|uniref:Protamine P1 n=1 Tax=Apiosordaria backusii TaxID=314023 RepID=A0AA40K787_9PEZI|nr:hypothetical protein B0T21DRAFT_420578 [Apiosordaria backusii]
MNWGFVFLNKGDVAVAVYCACTSPHSPNFGAWQPGGAISTTNEASIPASWSTTNCASASSTSGSIDISGNLIHVASQDHHYLPPPKMTNGWVQGNQERRFLQPDHFGDQDVYCEANHDPDDVLYIGSDDDDYDSPADRRERCEAQARRYLEGKRLHLISASLSGPFTKASGWTNPWRSKSGVRKSSKRKRPPTAKKPVANIQPLAPYESSELSSPQSNIVQLDDAPTQDADDESLLRVQHWRDRVLAEIPVNAAPTNHYPSQTEPDVTPSKPPAPVILNGGTSSELSPPPDSPFVITPIRPKKTMVYTNPSPRDEEPPPQRQDQTPGAGQAMLLPIIDLSPHAIRLFEESFYSRESSKSSPVRQPLSGSPLKNCTPAPKILVQQPLEAPAAIKTPADVGSAVTTASKKLPGSTQTDGSFRFRKTRQKQRNLPLRKSSRLSGVVLGSQNTNEERNQHDEALPEIRVAEDQTHGTMRTDQDTPQATAPSSSDNDQVVIPPEFEVQNVTQGQVEPQSDSKNPEQCAVESSQRMPSQIDGPTLVPPSSSEEDREDVSMGNFSCERESSSQDVAAVLGSPKRLLWPKPGLDATRRTSGLAFRLDSAPVLTLYNAREPAVPEPDKAAITEQPSSEVLENVNAGPPAAEETNVDHMVKSGPVEIETAEAAEEVTVQNMGLKPEPEEPEPQPPRLSILFVSAGPELQVSEPQIPEPHVLEPQVLERAVLAPAPAPEPKCAPEPERVSAPATEPVPDPATVMSPGSLAPAVNGLMAEIAQRATQGLSAIRRVLEQGTESSYTTNDVVIPLTAKTSDTEAVTTEEQLVDAAPRSSLADETASLYSPGIVTSQMVLDHPEAGPAAEVALDHDNIPTNMEKESLAGSETASEAEEMDIDTGNVTDPEKAQEVTETISESKSTSVSPHRSRSPAPAEQSPWAADTVSLPLGGDIDTPVPSRVAALSAPDSCQSAKTQSPWAKGDSQLQVTIPPAPEIRSFVPFSSPANSAVLQRPETPPPQIIIPDCNNNNNNSQASIAQLSTPESNKSAQRTPENNNFSLSTKSFRDFMTPSPQPAKRRKISTMSSSVRNSAAQISSTQLLFDAATTNPWTPGILSSGGRSLRPTPTTKPKSLLRQSLSSSTTPSVPRKRKHVTFAPLPGEIPAIPASSPIPPPDSDPSSPYFSAEFPSTTPTAITASIPTTPVTASVPNKKTRPCSPPPSSLSADLPTASTEKFAKHFAKVATKRLGHTTLANPVAKLRQKRALLPSASQQVCESPGVEAMAEAFVLADCAYRHSSPIQQQRQQQQQQQEGGDGDDEEGLLQSQLDSQLGIVIDDCDGTEQEDQQRDGVGQGEGEEETQEETQEEEETQDPVSEVMLNLDDFLGVGGGLWDVDSAVKDMARERQQQQREEEEEMRRLEMGLGGSVWE